MPLAFVFDENLAVELQGMVARHNQAVPHYALDTLQVGDGEAPPKGTLDPDLLVWAEENHRLLVTWDKRSMPDHLVNHLSLGHHSPGVFIVRPVVKLPELVSTLAIIAYASAPDEWRDRYEWIP